MQVGVLGALIVLVSLASFVLLIVALVDLVKRPPQAWAESGHNQIVWALIIVFVGLIGPVLYLVIARPALDGRSQVNAVPVNSR